MPIIRAISLAIILLAGLLAAAAFWFRPVYHNEFARAECCLWIAHAGGAASGVAYTNSAEALDEGYAAGRRVFELDFSELADGSLVLAHDFNDLPAPPPDRETFLASPEPHGLTRLDFAAFALWLQAHPDAVLITDTKFEGGPHRLAEALETYFPPAEIARRVVFQIYSLEALADDTLRRRGYREMLTIYRIERVPVAEIAAAVAQSRVLALTIPAWRGPRVLRYFRAALPDLPIYVHGTPDSINRKLKQGYLSVLGADGFFLD
jgi:hypothetical protein